MGTLYDSITRDRQGILEIAHRHHAANVRLFGSVARGEEQEGSDIDFLVDFLPGTTLLDQVGLIQELSTKLDRKVDVVSARALNKHLRQRVLDEAIEL
jgi:predicted nucleotidyltransferase